MLSTKCLTARHVCIYSQMLHDVIMDLTVMIQVLLHIGNIFPFVTPWVVVNGLLCMLSQVVHMNWSDSEVQG